VPCEIHVNEERSEFHWGSSGRWCWGNLRTIKGAIYNALESYLEFGGFPELVSIDDDGIRFRILQEYFDVMLFRDLVERYEIKNLIALKFFIVQNNACLTRLSCYIYRNPLRAGIVRK
jgi:predicted AAA+ superfamily ATPase